MLSQSTVLCAQLSMRVVTKVAEVMIYLTKWIYNFKQFFNWNKQSMVRFAIRNKSI